MLRYVVYGRLHTALFFCLILSFPFSSLISQEKDLTPSLSAQLFRPATGYASGEQNWSLTQADLNQDGWQDLITAGRLDRKVWVHLNDGKGNLLPGKVYPGLDQIRSIAAADVDGDKAADIVLGSLDGRIALLLNDGTGALLKPKVIASGLMIHHVALADLNQDGKMDILGADVSGHGINIHLNQGDNRFSAVQKVRTGKRPLKGGRLLVENTLHLKEASHSPINNSAANM
ncbi:MAG: VCBS repeat-containing protein [Bacteroidota bacterium]